MYIQCEVIIYKLAIFLKVKFVVKFYISNYPTQLPTETLNKLAEPSTAQNFATEHGLNYNYITSD